MFTLNVDYDQLKYKSGDHTPFNFIQLWFSSHLRNLKYNRQGNEMVPYRVDATIIIGSGEKRTKDSFRE